MYSSIYLGVFRGGSKMCSYGRKSCWDDCYFECCDEDIGIERCYDCGGLYEGMSSLWW